MSKFSALFWWPKPPVVLSYGVAVLSVAGALAIARWLSLHLETAPVSLFLCAVMFSAWSGGFGPGLLAVALSVLTFKYYFVFPIYSLAVQINEIPRLLIFALSGLFAGALSAAQRSAAGSLGRACDHLNGTVQELNRINEALQAENTERKRADEELRQSEERFRRLVELLPVAVYVCDTAGIIQSYNNRAVELWGRDPKPGDTAQRYCGSLRLYSPDGNLVPHQESIMAEALRTGIEARDVEVVIERPDGSCVTALVNIVPLRNGGGELIGAINCFQDITERKRAEEALRRSEAYLAEGQRLSHTGSWAWNLSSGELFWSQETYRIFGFDPAKTAATLNEAFLQRIHPEDRPRIEQGLSTAPIQEGPYGVAYRIVLPDGSIKHIQDVVYPVTNEAGDVVERYGVIMDVTERTRAEEALQRSRDQLRALAARLQSVREEERTNVAREIHDELGQALTAIKIDLASLISEPPPNRTEQLRRAASILKLVDEAIHSVRRISTQLRPGILDDLGLVAAVEWAAEEFGARTGTRCRLDLPQSDIVTDPERATALFRIFQETLTNVARHANATQVDVRLAKEKDNLLLEVRDNGKGISEEQVSGGKSLGILGMRERASLLGGEITISGIPGKGTTVSVLIPEASSHAAGAS